MLKKIFSVNSRGWFMLLGMYPFVVFALYQDNKLPMPMFIMSVIGGMILGIIMLKIYLKVRDILTQKIRQILGGKLDDFM